MDIMFWFRYYICYILYTYG